MKTTTMEMMVGCLAACCAFNAMATEPTISDVTVRQRWPWSRLVDIDYVLTCDDTQRVDIVLNAYNGPTALSLPESSLSGNLYNVTEGPRRIVWDPTATAYTNSQILTQFNVTLATAPLPVYMIVDLTLAAGAEGQIEYVYPGDERLVTDGRFTNVWFSVTNDTTYMTTKLVMRRIPAGSYTMGSSTPVTMTNDFYAGVFEVTQEQWKNIYASYAGAFITERATRPAESMSYNTIRGATNSSPVVNWPSTGHTVTPDSFIGKPTARGSGSKRLGNFFIENAMIQGRMTVMARATLVPPCPLVRLAPARQAIIGEALRSPPDKTYTHCPPGHVKQQRRTA